MTKELLKKFKETKTWRSLLLYFIKPIYEFIWQYLINFQGKLLYFLWFLKKRDYYELGGNNKIIIKDNNEVSSLCKQILNFADDDFIEIQRKKIIQGDTGTIGTKSAFRKKSRNCSRQFFIDKRKPYKEFYEYIKSEYKKNYSNIFLNFLLFKRSSIIEKLKISELSMAFFR